MATVRTIIEQHPAFATAYGTLASMQRDTGNLGGAIATLEQILRRGIADQRVMVVLAGYFLPPLIKRFWPGFDLALHIDKIALGIVFLSIIPILLTVWKERKAQQAGPA